MSAPPIRFPDAQLAARDALRPLVPAATVSTRDAATGGPRPVIVVRAGAPSRTSRLSADAIVRLSVYAEDTGASIALAADVEALLLAGASSDRIRSFGPLTGPVASTDPDTNEPFALVTLTARLRPLHLERT